MSWWAFPTRTRPAALASALDDEIARLERLVLYAWQGVAALGILVAGVCRLLLPQFGVGVLVGAVVFLALFLAIGAIGRRAQRLRFWLQVLAESALPWIFVALLARTQGSEYALGSWVPPMLYGCVICLGILRLRPLVPFVVGVAGAVQYEALYLVSVHAGLSEAAAHSALFGPRMQIVRSLSILTGGFLSSAVAFGFRRVIGKAARTARAQDLFGKYRIERRIASGGMATVYEATYCPEGGFARPVAIKRIHPHLALEPSFVGAFRNEAELGARLVHPNIVQVLDFGRVEETYFLAMEYMDGATLGAIMRHVRSAGVVLSEALVAWIGGQLADGLSYSHGGACDQDGKLLRIVHRDLSPANVLTSKNGQVKLSDFGIARALRDANAYVTVSVAGHMSYMAPEQAAGQETDERSDLFALAVILWELLCGATLFRRETEAKTLLAVLGDDAPSPSSKRQGIDPGWDPFFARALDRDPTKRLPTARALGDALTEIAARVGAPKADELRSLIATVSAVVQEATEKSEAPTVSLSTRGPGLAAAEDGAARGLGGRAGG